PRFNLGPNSVFGDAIDCLPAHCRVRYVDDFRVDTGSDRFKNGFAGSLGRKINSAGAIEIEGDTSLVGSDERQNHLIDTAAGEKVGFEWIAGDFEPGLYRRNSVVHDVSYGNLAQPHANHFAETYRRVGNACANPETEEVEEDDAENECEYRDDRDRDQVKRFHNSKLIGTRKM